MPSKQKLMRTETWDLDQQLADGGGHTPLLVFLGSNPRRSVARYQAREAKWKDHQKNKKRRPEKPRARAKARAKRNLASVEASSQQGPDRPQIQHRHSDSSRRPCHSGTLTVVTVIQYGGMMKSGHVGGVSLTPSAHGSGGMASGTCGAADSDRGDGC